ncbi:hypothetical protein J5U23_01341 [Saccharolobus shibatae B12]|uniref:Uncharacterized protein n=1 Tax=Saccharolobus shibatae (strain ATCC 51178 / DSM 5389 / JCM 8931 / NBRC 15437 / B12) TaxID=523848 RepID=A0A8F5GTK7_SACSH|nr:hypothetical protein J5U23_01341 [Saccharolobus shibatae B12]
MIFDGKVFIPEAPRPGRDEGSHPEWLIVPTIDSGLHLSFGGQSSGSEIHSHLEIGDPSSTLSGSREIENGDDSCSSLSLIKPSIELERRIINATKKNSTKEVFKLYKGAIHPRLREARLSAPLTPFFVS